MKKNRLLTFVAVSVLAAAPAVSADNGSVAVYLDAAGTQCQGPITGFTLGSVWMNLGGTTAPGMTGVEFRIDNSDAASYDCSFVPDAGAAISLGNPFFGGCNLAFSTCQMGTAGRVMLGTVVINPVTTSTSDVLLTVRPHLTPSNENFQCVLATACDTPYFTSICVGAPNSDHWRTVINPSGAIAGDCQPVAVQAQSWSRVKALYKN